MFHGAIQKNEKWLVFRNVACLISFAVSPKL